MLPLLNMKNKPLTSRLQDYELFFKLIKQAKLTKTPHNKIQKANGPSLFNKLFMDLMLPFDK